MYVWVLTVHDVIQTWTKWRHNLQESNKGRVAVEFLWWFFLLKWLVCWSLCANPPCWWSDVWVMLKNLERADRKKHCNLLLWLGGTVKTSIAILWPLRKTRGVALTRKSWSWRCTAKDSYINDTMMAVWTVYATWGIATRLCELTELCEGSVECTELLKTNDRILLSLGTFVHVLSEHSVLSVLFFLYFDCISFPWMQKKASASNWP